MRLHNFKLRNKIEKYVISFQSKVFIILLLPVDRFINPTFLYLGGPMESVHIQ